MSDFVLVLIGGLWATFVVFVTLYVLNRFRPHDSAWYEREKEKDRKNE